MKYFTTRDFFTAAEMHGNVSFHADRKRYGIKRQGSGCGDQVLLFASTRVRRSESPDCGAAAVQWIHYMATSVALSLSAQGVDWVMRNRRPLFYDLYVWSLEAWAIRCFTMNANFFRWMTEITLDCILNENRESIAEAPSAVSLSKLSLMHEDSCRSTLFYKWRANFVELHCQLNSSQKLNICDVLEQEEFYVWWCDLWYFVQN